jgi:hypothetical protein
MLRDDRPAPMTGGRHFLDEDRQRTSTHLAQELIAAKEKEEQEEKE